MSQTIFILLIILYLFDNKNVLNKRLALIYLWRLILKGCLFFLLFIHAVSYCQQNWEIEYYNLANLNFASNHYKAANQFYNVQNYFSSLDNLKNENQFYSIETLLRRNVPGSDKMLNLYIIDNPTSCLSETAFFDAANFI